VLLLHSLGDLADGVGLGIVLDQVSGFLQRRGAGADEIGDRRGE
jgi:hypothetical protein